MGLDITVHTQVEKIPTSAVPLTEDGEIDYVEAWETDLVHTFVIDAGFMQSLRGLDQDGWVKSVGDSYHFRAGSYGGYGFWRDALSYFALGVPASYVWAMPQAYTDKPFFELINFADNEGSIGPEAAADLAEDFRNLHDKAKADMEPDVLRLYETWMKACADAAHRGMIEFH